jgi:hypothetical protein
VKILPIPTAATILPAPGITSRILAVPQLASETKAHSAGVPSVAHVAKRSAAATVSRVNGHTSPATSRVINVLPALGPTSAGVPGQQNTMA